jgi:predicted MFS family arabinose efflux permease
VAGESRQLSERQKAWAEVAGEVGAILLGGLIAALGLEDFGYGLMAFGVIGFVVTFVRRRRTLLGPADE